MKPSAGVIAIVVAVLIVAILVTISVGNWNFVGNSGIDLNGWIALILGVVATLAVGIGLMTLVFVSNRRGYDDPPDKRG
ncbi:MAG: hypothetical protein WAV02_07190 [Stellaceae bacterium]